MRSCTWPRFRRRCTPRPIAVFRTNIVSTHAVFAAAAPAGVQRVVWASSEMTLGLPFEQPPDYAPVDEEHELRPESAYALSKVLGEEMARQFSRWSGIPFVGLRFSNMMGPCRLRALPRLLGRSAPAQVEPVELRRREGRRSERQPRARSRRPGAETFIVAAADTVMRRPSRELMAEVFPDVPVRDGWPSTDTLLAIDKAAEPPRLRARSSAGAPCSSSSS